MQPFERAAYHAWGEPDPVTVWEMREPLLERIEVET